MAAKKNSQTGVEEEAPVTNTKQSNHDALRSERRVLEAELAEIDGRVRSAIDSGDASALASLSKRKVELPGLFIVASMAETEARREIVNAEDAANAEALEAAHAERQKIAAQLIKRKEEYEKEIAALNEALQEADGKIATLYSLIAAARNLGASREAAFKASLSKLAGV